jgi:hypothetical protein
VFISIGIIILVKFKFPEKNYLPISLAIYRPNDLALEITVSSSFRIILLAVRPPFFEENFGL